VSRTLRAVPLIGGPRDGGVMNVHDGDDIYTISYMEQFVPPVYAKMHYRREVIAGQDEKFHVFVADGVSIDQALQKLVRGYRRPRP
jgi:hypothetical protein